MVIFWVLIVLMAAAILFVIGYPAYLYWHYRKYGKWPNDRKSHPERTGEYTGWGDH